VEESNGHKVVITDKDGSRDFNVRNGADGERGENGKDGISPAISIGTVSTLESGASATATLSGTAQAPVLNLGIPKGADGASADSAPQYIHDAVETMMETLIELQRKSCMTFLAMTDFHELTGNTQNEISTLHAGLAAKELANSIRLDFAAILGDLTGDFSENEIARINRHISDACAGIPNFRTPGEHDYLTKNRGTSGKYLNENQIYSLFGKFNDGVFDDENKVSGYCYSDFDEHKIRVICLNTAEIKGLTINSNDYIERISARQLQWFAGALDLSAKANAEQWGIVILSHHPLDYNKIMPAAKVLNAYLNGSSLSLSHEGGQVSYDFSGKNSAEVICQFHGHLHNFKSGYIRSDTDGTLTTVQRICIPNVSFSQNNPNFTDKVFGEMQFFNKVANTARDTAFNIVSIDRTARQIHCTCYGSGKNRVVEY
ncbi:MAG: hypothetical protein NC110_03350, partial [Ruminococcus sp.]|nr:hypothetical protein [Ruminococcus sp.]